MKPALSLIRISTAWPTLALLSALLLALSMPGLVGWWFLICIALVPLLFICRCQQPSRAFAAGLLCGFTHNLVLLYWIIIVLGRYGGLPWPISLAALCALSLYMALYVGVLAALLSFCSCKGSKKSCQALFFWAAPFIWVGLEYARALLFTGFPWMDIGYALSGQARLIQAADLGGVYCISFFVLLVNCVIAEIMLSLLNPSRKKNTPLLQCPRSLLCASALLLLVAAYSFLRFEHIQQLIATAPSLPVTVVQGNISQDQKWTAAMRRNTVERYIRLSKESKKGGLLVWPETALPFYPQQSRLSGSVVKMVQQQQTWLLTGAPWFEHQNDIAHPSVGINTSANTKYFNSALLLGKDGQFQDIYHKGHLVPFGEYIPLRRLLFFLQPLVEGGGNFTQGTSFLPLEAGDARLGVLICYESIFPKSAAKQVAAGANLLLNITNDAWYGRSSAPHQSMAMAIMRAVENRRSLARAANTGISGFILPSGELHQQSSLFAEATLHKNLPLLSITAPYQRWGQYFGLLCLLTIPGWLAWAWFQRQRCASPPRKNQ